MHYYHLNIDNKHTKKAYHKLKIYLKRTTVSNIFIIISTEIAYLRRL